MLHTSKHHFGSFGTHKKTGLFTHQPGFYPLHLLQPLMRRFGFMLLRTLEVVGQLVFVFIERHGDLTAVNQ